MLPESLQHCYLDAGAALAVSLPLSVPLKLVFLLVFFFSHMVFWNLPLRRLDFHNYSLVCGCLPSAALSRFSPTTADRVGAGCWFCRPYQGLSFCSQMHKWARLFPGCLPSIAAGSHKFHRDFCGWMPNWLLKTGGQKVGPSYTTLMPMS